MRPQQSLTAAQIIRRYRRSVPVIYHGEPFKITGYIPLDGQNAPGFSLENERHRRAAAILAPYDSPDIYPPYPPEFLCSCKWAGCREQLTEAAPFAATCPNCGEILTKPEQISLGEFIAAYGTTDAPALAVRIHGKPYFDECRPESKLQTIIASNTQGKVGYIIAFWGMYYVEMDVPIGQSATVTNAKFADWLKNTEIQVNPHSEPPYILTFWKAPNVHHFATAEP